ncbi:MAG TPA: TrkA family potassium uptake protein [Candidatus Limnocylindrales bacterium]
MKIVIVGCGRVGSTLAENLDADGHEVIIFDVKTSAFDRLPETFKGAAIRGDGTDVDVLRRSGAEGSDIFLALTEGDNRNVMAAQVATESLGVAQVIAKINDPVRAAAYAELGIATLCRTNLMVDSVANYLNLPMQTGPGIDTPEATGHEHPHPTVQGVDAPAFAGPPAEQRNGTSSAADAARASRLGFRRPRA